MKKFNSWLTYLMSALLIVAFTACDDSEDDIDLGDGSDGISVGDGYYITEADADPVSTSKLVAENVEDGFGSIERENYYAGYVYLTAGNYNLVNVVEREITETLGGTASAEIFDAENCEDFDYSLIAAEKDGAAFAVAADGLYKVTYDVTTSEILVAGLSKASLIGAATEIGWAGGSTVDLDGTVSAASGAWQGTEIILREGEFKLRFDCNWKIDRTEYIVFTNFGADADAPVSGANVNLTTGNDGGNIKVSAKGGTFPDEGAYTIDVAWSAENGFAMSLTRTGDAPEVAFDPEDYAWGIIGSATQGTTDGENPTDGWGNDKKFYYKKDGAKHIWRGVFPLEAEDAEAVEFKFRTDDAWSNKLTPGTEGLTMTITDNTEDGSISDNGAEEADGSWFVDANPGFYYFEIATEDDGENWTLLMDEASFGIIGAATPGGWDADTDLAYSDDLASASATMNMVDGELKFRVNDAWDYGLGGTDLTALKFDVPDNYAYTGAGSKVVTITTANGGESYSATIE
ncbi:hypothetical protein [Reichenbachiella sp.]|uniref:hypothetical protein n=1 Tax=Reichenbachiella sp. TaxID=2184521 RepID=UPI003B5ADE63